MARKAAGAAGSRKSMQEMGFHSVTAYLPEELYQALRRYSFEKNVPHSELLRSLLEQELKRSGLWKK